MIVSLRKLELAVALDARLKDVLPQIVQALRLPRWHVMQFGVCSQGGGPPDDRPLVLVEEQGTFESYHTVLMADTTWYGAEEWVSLARAAGVADTALFSACLHHPRTAGVVDGHAELARRLGIRGTPTFLARGAGHEGVAQAAQLRGLGHPQ